MYFATLGVTNEMKRKGIGSALMFDAFTKTLTIAENVGVYCLWLTAIDKDACAFYERLGFSYIDEKDRRNLDMYISRAVISDAVG